MCSKLCFRNSVGKLLYPLVAEKVCQLMRTHDGVFSSIYYSCIKQCLSPKGMCFPLSKFSWHSNFTTFSLRVLCCYSLGCIPKLLLGSYSWRFQVVEKNCEVIWRAVRRMTCGSCFKEMVKLCFFVHFGKGYGGPAKRWLYVTQQKQCLMCTIRLY